jgi:[amino group carrier protein]-L-2-aminoadipate 6-kinase
MILIKAGGGKDVDWDAIGRDLAGFGGAERFVVVHGASVLRDEIAARLSVPVRTVVSPSGVPSVYTDREALEVFLMAYAGLANKTIVAVLQSHGLNAVGLCGVDGRLWQAAAKKDLVVQEGGKTLLLRDNRTGRVERTNAGLIRLLVENGYLPVVSAPAISFEHEIVNTDNDWAAAVMAGDLGISKIVYLFEAAGLLRDPDDPGSLIPHMPRFRIGEAMPFARGRMKKKLLGAKRAIEAGVEAVYFGDGRIPDPVRSALEGKGTVID